MVLPTFLLARGFRPCQVGALITATLIGSAGVTLTVGLRGGRIDRVRLLQAMSVLMVVTGVLFGVVAGFAALLLVAAVGSVNPSSGDVSAFLPIEQSLLPDTVTADRRTHAFARFTLVASLAGAAGSLAAAGPGWLAERTELSELDAQRGVFFAYAVVGALLLLQFRRLSPRGWPPASASSAR